MAISDVIEKLGRVMFEAPFGANRIAKDAPEMAEIRLAVLDAAKAKSHRVNGRHVFPYNFVRIQLLGIPEEQAAVFRSEFLANYFAEELRAGLSRSNYRFPEDLRIEISPVPRLPEQGEQWLRVETELRQEKPVEPPVRARRAAKLVVTNGKANLSELVLEKTRTNIGRTAEIYSAAGPLRRNDLAFTEENPINQTVSREHAHIVYSQKSGEYRIFNDRAYRGDANCGLWIVRDGLSQPVHRSSRGVLLKPGDEIHLGTAVLRFQSR
jgi:pSer/pThr/pTyr-binding forkhead associated (FHA) protein